jgi:hypothetical protein
MYLKAKQSFSWAHQGVRIEEFAKGQLIETDDEDLIAVSVREGWAEKAKAPNKAEQKKAIEARVAELETQLLAAEEGEEAAIEAEIQAVKAELVALG